MRNIRRRLAALIVVAAMLLVGCSGYEEIEADPAEDLVVGAVVAPLTQDTLLGVGSAVDLAVAASETFFSSAGIVVLTAADEGSQLRAAWLAMLLGLPALVVDTSGNAPEAVVAELERLGAQTVLLVGDVEVPSLAEDRPFLRAVAAPGTRAQLQVVLSKELDGEVDVASGEELRAVAEAQSPFTWILGYASDDTTTSPTAGLADLPGLPPYLPTERRSGVAVLADNSNEALVALGTARAAGADVVLTDSGQVLGNESATAQLYALQPEVVVGAGRVGQIESLGYQVRVAASGTDLPGGGQMVLPNKRYLALRGVLGDTESGRLGQQDVTTAFEQIEDLASSWSTRDTIVPTAALLATQLTSDPGSGGTYSSYASLEDITAAIEVAESAGAMVLLVLQPGRETFLAQLDVFAEPLSSPNVGVVLEPRARLSAQETPETASGEAGDAEIAEAITWIANFTLQNVLPPKLVVVSDPVALLSGITYRPEVSVAFEVNGSPVTADVTGDDAVSYEEVWDEATVSTLPYWGWRQGTEEVPLSDLATLWPQPVLVTYP